MAAKRKQDEKHLNILRGMAKLEHNKQCLDCHQRGPTYLNMTIGAFVCTGCSGLIRGLNPPHRVKSISMASFTPEEIEFVKSRGNEFCRKVWLGLYDNRKIDFVDKDENKIKDFMVQKYEKKRYYVAPTETMMEEARKENTPPKTEPQTKPLRSMGTIPSLSTPPQSSHAVPATSRPTPVQSLQTRLPTSQLTGGQLPTITPHQQQPQQQSHVQTTQKAGGGFDLLGELGGDPFASSNTGSTRSAGSGGFADFGAFPAAQPAASAQMPHSLSHPAGFPPNTGPGVLSPHQPAVPGNHPGNNMVVQSNSFSAFSSTTSSASAPTSVPAAAALAGHSDRYSALAALDTALSSSPASSGQAVNWDGSMFGGGGGTSSVPSGGANNNTAFGGAGQTSVSSAAGFNSAPNPFGTNTSAINANQGMVANPFSSAGTGFGQQQGSSFNQPGTGFNQMNQNAAPSNSMPSFGGHMGTSSTMLTTAAAAGGGGQFRGVANGNMNAQQPLPQQQQQQQMWGMNLQAQQPIVQGQQMNAFGGGAMNFGGAATPGGGMMAGKPAGAGFGGGQPQQQFGGGGGWGAAQSPTANPFMNVASQQPNRPLNSTNPFL